MSDMTQPAGGQPVEGKSSAWVFLAMVVALLGVAASIYSISHHLEVHATGHTDAACNINATFSCDEVALSKYSELGGIPLGVFGLGYFAAMLTLLGLGAWGGKSAKEHLHAYGAMVGVGLLTSVALAGISVGLLGNYCVTCIAVYALTILQGVALFMGRRDILSGFTPKSMFSGATTAAIAVAVVVVGFNFLKPGKNATESTNPAVEGKQPPALATTVEDIPLSKSAYSGLGEDYRKGADNASVVVMEFADFQCPACQRVSGVLEELHREFGDKVLIVYRNYPLDQSCNSAIQHKMHEHACQAAVIARCAGQYGKFWAFHDIAFANQTDISDANIKDWAKKIGLTQEQVDACWSNKDLLDKIKDDIAIGNKLNIDSTPTVYINGRKVIGGRGLAELKTQIEQLLN